MKKAISLLYLVTLTIGLLGSCSKINDRLDNLEKRVDDIENKSIATIQQQMDEISVSIIKLTATDATINGQISELNATARSHQVLIDALKAADQSLGQKDEKLEALIADLEDQVAIIDGQIKTLEDADKAINIRIDSLRSYVDTELDKVGDWATETFATLDQYQQTADDLAILSVTVAGIDTTLTDVMASIADLDTKIDGLDAALQEKITSAKAELEGKIKSLKTELEGKIASAISASETSIKAWINELLEGYYTAAQVDAKVTELNTSISNIKDADKARIDSLATELTTLKTAVDTAKAAIRTEYRNAIDVAINRLDGEIRGAIKESIAAVNGIVETLNTKVTALESRIRTIESKVRNLEAMIQSVSITPAYSDGSVEAVGGILAIKFIVRPAEALSGITSLKDSLLLYADFVKVRTRAEASAYMEIPVTAATLLDAAQGAITLRANIANYLPTGTDKSLVVALNVKNGISDYTTEFYPVTLSPNVTVKDETDTTKVTIKADADFPEFTMGTITVASGFTDSKPTTITVEGIGNITFDKEATAKIKSNAQSEGATNVFFKVEDVTTTKPVTNADVVLEVTMKTVDENGIEVFSKGKEAGEVTIEIPMDENVAYVNSVTLVNDAGEPIPGGVVPGSKVFDKENGILTFKVNHFSKYAIDYVTKAEYKAVTGVSIELASVTLQVDDTLRLAAVIAPEDATNKKVTWSSSDTTKVKVDDTGKITAVAFGQATITVTTKDGNKTATCTVKVSETKTMDDILKTTTGIPESVNLTPPANAWVNSPDTGCKAFIGVDAEGDKLFVIKKEGSGLKPLGICMDDAFAKIDDNTYQRIEPSVGTFTIKMAEGKFTSYEFAAVSGSAYEQFNGTYSAPVSSPTFKAVYNTTGDANTLTFYYDAVDHSGEGITVYDNLPSAAAEAADWGYNSNRGIIKSVVIDASVASYKGLTSTAYMFYGMTAASSISGAEHLDVSNVTDMSSMFYGFGFSSKSLTDIPNVTNWQTGNVTNMNSLFYGYGVGSGSLAEVPDVSKWNTAKVKNMSNMFNQYGKSSTVLTKVPIVNGSNWDTGEVTNMSGMFQLYGYTSESLAGVPDVSKWNTASVTDMSNMFKGFAYGSKVLTEVPAVNGSNWDTKAVTNMSSMFQDYGYTSTGLKAVPQVGNWNTEIVTKMGSMFYKYGYSSESLAGVPDVSKWNTANVTDMSYMFNSFAYKSTALTTVPKVDGSNWKTENLKDIDYMFQFYGNGAENIRCELDLSGWDLAKLSEGSHVFNFKPIEFNVTIPAKTGAKSNEGDKWYYGNGTNHIAPPKDKTFTLHPDGVSGNGTEQYNNNSNPNWF